MAEFKTKEEYEKWKAERAKNPTPDDDTTPKVVRILKKFSELQAADKAKENQFICTGCLTKGMPVMRTKGNFPTELLLWVLLILPGVLYTVWRLTSKEKVCPNCGKPTMIPIDSPMGRKLTNE